MPNRKDIVESLIKDIHHLRFQSYIQGSPATTQIQGLRAYRYNMALIQVLWEASAVLEIVLRNRIVESWNPWFQSNGHITGTQEWPINSWNIFNSIAVNIHHRSYDSFQTMWKIVGEAQRSARRELRRNTINNGDIVARLTFGFWHKCISSHYNFINSSRIRDIFPNYPFRHLNQIEKDISKISKDLQKIKDFRNRLAHHEKLDIAGARAMYQLINNYLNYMNPTALHLISINGFNKVITANILKTKRDFPYL